MTPRTQQLLTLTLGERFARARKVAELTQADIAVRMGVATRTVVRWETDVVVPPMPAIIAWSAVTDVPLEWLITGVISGDVISGESDAVTCVSPGQYVIPLDAAA